MKQIYLYLKIFLFNFFSYTIINVCFFMGMVLEPTGRKGGGDGDIGIAMAVFIIVMQLFSGLISTTILTIISIATKKHPRRLAVFAYFVINSVLLLFFLWLISGERSMYECYLLCITGAIWISFSFFYSFLLKRCFKE